MLYRTRHDIFFLQIRPPPRSTLLSLHDALPIYALGVDLDDLPVDAARGDDLVSDLEPAEHLQMPLLLGPLRADEQEPQEGEHQEQDDEEAVTHEIPPRPGPLPTSRAGRAPPRCTRRARPARSLRALRRSNRARTLRCARTKVSSQGAPVDSRGGVGRRG